MHNKKFPTIPGVKAWLVDPDIREVSLVKSPFIPCSPEANIQIAKAFKGGYKPELTPVWKSASTDEPQKDQVMFRKRFRIQKIDVEQQKIYGYVYPSNSPDLEGDAMTEDELEKAAHSLLQNLTDKSVEGEGAGLNHEKFENIFKFTESAIDHDGSLGKNRGFAKPLTKAWFLGAYVANDEIWKSILSGEITGFSWGGFATRIPVEESEQKAGILKTMASGIKGLLNKSEPSDFAEWQSVLEVGPKIDDMCWTLGDVIYWIMTSDLSMDEKKSKVMESIMQFYVAVKELFSKLPNFDPTGILSDVVGKLASAKESLSKTGTEINSLLETFEKINKGDDDMDEKEVQKAVEKALEPINTKLDEQAESITALTTKVDDVEKAAKPPAEGTDPAPKPDDDPVVKAIGEMKTELKTDIGELTKRIEKLETTPGTRKGEEGEEGTDPDAGKTDTQKAVKGTAFDFKTSSKQ
jgi:Putative phage serine protease XkdF